MAVPQVSQSPWAKWASPAEKIRPGSLWDEQMSALAELFDVHVAALFAGGVVRRPWIAMCELPGPLMRPMVEAQTHPDQAMLARVRWSRQEVRSRGRGRLCP